MPDGGAASAPLVYVTGSEPGIRRVRRGRGFLYLLSDGSPLRDEAVLARIRALAIPPAYTDVWICSDPCGHIQATGRDQKGRKQYRYHKDWHGEQDAMKFQRLVAFGHACRNCARAWPQTWRRAASRGRRCWQPW